MLYTKNKANSPTTSTRDNVWDKRKPSEEAAKAKKGQLSS